MKKAAICLLLLTTAAMAQRGSGLGVQPTATRQQPPMTPPSSALRTSAIGYGFGNVVFPSTGNPGSRSYNPYGVPAGRQGGGVRYNQSGVIPVAIPVYIGGYGYDYAPMPQQPIQVIMPPQQQQAPTIIINQNFTQDAVKPLMRDYTDAAVTPPPVAEEKPTIYLIAFRDGTIYPAYAYWQERETLHYITTKHDHNQASMDLIDGDLSESLNKERSLEFKLRR
jgi:hypothetical protein